MNLLLSLVFAQTPQLYATYDFECQSLGGRLNYYVGEVYIGDFDQEGEGELTIYSGWGSLVEKFRKVHWSRRDKELPMRVIVTFGEKRRLVIDGFFDDEKRLGVLNGALYYNQKFVSNLRCTTKDIQ